MRPYLATLYRRKKSYSVALLLMLCAVALGTYLRVLTSNEYQATARVWVSGETPSPGSASSPAQQQANVLYQLLQSDSFIAAVLQGASVGLTGMPDQDSRDIAQVRSKLIYKTQGSNTVMLAFSGQDPVLCQRIVQSTLDQVEKWKLDFQREQTAVRLQYHQQQLIVFRDQMNESRRRLDEYRARHPGVSESSAEYRELQRLQREYEVAQDLYLAKVRDTAAVSNTERQLDFQVMDKPIVPQDPSPPRHLLNYLLLGVAASFGLVLTMVVFMTWQDGVARTVDDLRRLSDAPVLAVVPHLSLSVEKRVAEQGAVAERPTLGQPKGLVPIAEQPSPGVPRYANGHD